MDNNKIRVSPSTSFTEQDLTFIPSQVLTTTTLGLVGESLKGRAFTPTYSASPSQFKTNFGGMNPCKYKDSQMLKYESAYIAKEFLSESNADMWFTRVLGLSGYDAGEAWGIKINSNIDIDTIVQNGTYPFTGELIYIDGELSSATFTDESMQVFYDAGNFTPDIFGGSGVVIGANINSQTVYQGDCDGSYFGVRFQSVVSNKVEQFVNLTVNTTNITTQTSAVTHNTCAVDFSAGTVSYNSDFYVQVTTPIVIINQSNNDIKVVAKGLLHIKGGTINHNQDDSVTATNSIIYLPNGDIMTGGVYKICDLASNNVYYNCDTFNGINYAFVTGTTVVNQPVVITGTTTSQVSVPSGVITVTLSGTAFTYSGLSDTSTDNSLVLLLRSNAHYDGDENLNFDIQNSNIVIEPIVSGAVIKPYDDFKLKGVLRTGATFEYIVSLDKRKSNYIQKVFSSKSLCCESGLPLYVEEMFDVMFDKMVANNQIYCIKPTMCHITTLNNYKQQYQGGVTPYVVSELMGNKVKRLFRFKTVGDGSYVNREFKLSIVNIKPDERTFDLLVRDYNDTDKAPVILESYTRLTLDETSNNFIGRKIGDGDKYSLVSKYIMLDIEYDNCDVDVYPAGFEGYPVRDYECANAPKVNYKSNYDANDKIKNVYLGISDVVGYDDEWFDYNGLKQDGTEWTTESKGFHLDASAGSVYVDGFNGVKQFEVGQHSFKNEYELVGTTYEKINARKFTFTFYGGFDGWDIFRQQRTNTDVWKAGTPKSNLSFTKGNIDALAFADEEIGLVTNADYYAFLKGIRTFANPEQVKINLFSTANINGHENSNLVESAIEMIESERCDAFYVFALLDTNYSNEALTPKDLAGSIDGLFKTSWAATYNYWGLYNDTDNNIFVYTSPISQVVKAFAYTDRVAKAWYASAGISRGATNFKNIRKNPTIDDRDTLYDNRINPLWKDSGITYIWGNKTLQGGDTALDSISVRRLLIQIRQLFADVAKKLLFEPNDDTVKRQFENLILPILNNIKQERGIFDFRVELDNSLEAQDRGELNGKVCIKPIKDVEFINIGFCLKNNSSEFDNI